MSTIAGNMANTEITDKTRPLAAPDQSDAIGPNSAEVQTANARQRAQRELTEQERESVRAAQAEQERLQRETEVAPQSQEPPTKVGDGGTKVRYLGTSDEFNFGPASEEDQRHVIARAGGDPVEVPTDLFESLKALPHDQFEETE